MTYQVRFCEILLQIFIHQDFFLNLFMTKNIFHLENIFQQNVFDMIYYK